MKLPIPLNHLLHGKAVEWERLEYIQRNYISETVIKHPDRAEATRVENFPYAAIEEAVANAVYHRGYNVREPIEVRITRDELVVLSYPGPDRSVRLADLQAGHAAIATAGLANFSRNLISPRGARRESRRYCTLWSPTVRRRPFSTSTRTTPTSWCGCRFIPRQPCRRA